MSETSCACEQHSSVDMYVNCGMLVEAQHVLNDLPCTFWNGLVIGYSKHMHGEEAPSCFEQVQLMSWFVFTFSHLCCVLKICGRIRVACKDQESHNELVPDGLLEIDLDMPLFTLQLCKRLELARNVARDNKKTLIMPRHIEFALGMMRSL